MQIKPKTDIDKEKHIKINKKIERETKTKTNK